MQISDEDIKKIATLSRISVAEKDLDRYRVELSAILTYVAQLSEVETEGVETFDHVSTDSKLREDKATNTNTTESRDELLQGAPKTKDGFIVVEKVFDR